MIQRDDITGIVLCGGAGRRMGGRDKPLEELAGEPLIAHVVARLSPQVLRIVISCNRNAERYRRWSDTVIVDEVRGQGPLWALSEALARVDTPYAFACPGDAPLLSASLVSTLSHAANERLFDACVPYDGTRTQHLFVLLRVGVREQLRQHLQGGGRSVHGWLESLQTISVDASAIRNSFVNVNSLDDLQSLNATLAQEKHR